MTIAAWAVGKTMDTTSVRWLIPNRLGKSDLPSEDDLVQWRRYGISSVANLVGEKWGTDAAVLEEKLGFRVLHEKIPDFRAPSLDQIKRIVSWMEGELESGRTVIVHCLGGIGRTGTILAAYLVKQGYSLKDALWEIEKVGAYPQTSEQHDIVAEYLEEVESSQS
jgi:atypical dual specificity phosphatase